MVNLRAVANSYTRAINPNVPADLYISNGNVTNQYHEQRPTYVKAAVQAQVQALTTGDLRQLDALNIQGANKAIYLNGVALALLRNKQVGGDIIVFADGVQPEGNVWLVKANLEQWGTTWCKVAVVLQDDDVAPDAEDVVDSGYVPALQTGV